MHGRFADTAAGDRRIPGLLGWQLQRLLPTRCSIVCQGNFHVRLESKYGEIPFMRTAYPKLSVALLGLALALWGQKALAQNSQTQTPPPSASTSQSSTTQPSPQTSPGGDVGHGAGDIGKGTAKGAGSAAKGIGKGAGDLVTLHPVKAAGNVGKGAAGAGKDVGVGAAKGTGKIAKGTGRGIGKIFHHHHATKTPPSQ
jgi:hypothetical protein